MKFLIVSNMYPNRWHPSYGVFVKRFCDQLDVLQIEYTKCVMTKRDSKISKIIGYISFYFKSVIKLLLGSYDVVYVHYASHSSLPVLFAHKLRSKPIYVNVHGSDVFPQNSRQERMQRYTESILKLCNKVIVPSEYFKNCVIEKYSIDEKKIFVSPSGGVNRKVFFKDKEKNNGKILKIGYVGRIACGKGWDIVIKACQKLTIPYQLTVAGNGPEIDKMLRLIASMNMHEHTIVMDLQPQEILKTIYNSLDVLIFPSSLKESLGLVAIEAMACGTPVIASDYAAQSFYIENGVNGIKFKCGDVCALTRCIEMYYALPAESKEKLSVGAVSTAIQFSEENVIDGINIILNSQEKI